MSSFISQTYIPSEIITKSSSSVSHTAPNRIYMYKFIHEILSLTDHEIERLIQSDSFHLLHNGIQKFYDENKNSKENEINHLFEDFLHKRNFNYIHDTCSYNDKIFVDLFSNLKPDMSWNCTTGSRLNDYSSCPFFFKSIIELKTKKVKTKDYDQIASYLTSILRYSPGRKFIIGCLTNFEETMLIKVLYDDTINQIKYITQATVTQLTGLQILTLFLSLSDTQLGYNEKFINIFSNKKIVFLHYLGRGSSSFVFYCESQQEQLTKFVLKISRQNCIKEKFIIEEMNKIKRENMNLIQCMNMNFDDDYADYLITFNLRGVKLDKLFIQRFLDDTQLLINIWQQVHLCNLWNKDDLRPRHSCWLSTDNAFTFTGAHEGVITRLRDYLATDCLEVNACVAHSFSLVGSQSCYVPKTQKSQSLLGCLQETMFDCNISNLDRENAKDLLNTILDDEFLFLIHMHHDLHESILGKSSYILCVTFIVRFSQVYLV
ncbi:unnamed protein product [Rotaria sp. Silwood1]|nr:unnamed protein product [Rotaria sp. Silwood1]